MPFDPTVPAPHAELTSQMFRDQFNGLKAIIDDLTARVAALENPPVPTYTAAGFGDAASNGVLTVIGTFNNAPLYQTAGGDYVFLTTDTATPGWRITAQNPTVSVFNVKYSTNAGSLQPTAITDPWYVLIAGTAPAGTVS